MTDSDQVVSFLQSLSNSERSETIACPNCEKTYRSPGIEGGKLVKCVACSHTFRASNAKVEVGAESAGTRGTSTSQVPEEESDENVVEIAEAETEKRYFTIRIPRLLLLCIAAVFLLQVVYLAGVVLIEILGSEPDASDSVANNVQEVDRENDQEQQNDPKKLTAEFEIKIEGNAPKRTEQSNPFLPYLNRAAEQQRQQQQQWKQFSDDLHRCQSCGGRGSYSYVDNFGNLRTRTCPYCNGLGNNKLIDERMRR